MAAAIMKLLKAKYDCSFNRMGGQMRYVTTVNRDFRPAIVKGLENSVL